MITQNIITPAKIQLTPLVRNLHIIGQRNGYGNTITGYHITFKPENSKYDKLVGFHKTNIGTYKWMVQNVKYNQWLTPKQKRKALNHIKGTRNGKRRRANHKHEPIKAFNNTLKTASLNHLRWLLSLHETHSKTVNFSEYQVRKLKKTIIHRVYVIMIRKKRLNK